ncbi:MAG: alpha/beta hydrolase [Planctomycetaceae bacterium]|nr:MAG: alpha/beta hydrolase [Planctomycetaceae bacterium]
MAAHPQGNALIAVPIPFQMLQAGYTWPDLVAAAGYAGPAESKFDGLAKTAAGQAGRGANALVYVPEAVETSGSVPLPETTDLEAYVDRLAAVAAEYGYIPVYGPGLSLVSDPATWAYGKAYDLQAERIADLASRLPAGSFWILRMFTPELMFGPTAEFGQAVADYAGAIHAGNPGVKIILHLSCPAGSEAKFLSFMDVSRAFIDMAYMGIDPVRDNAGTLLTMAAILEATGAGPIVSPTDTPEPPTPAPAVFYDLAYGPDPAHRLDLYLPGGPGPYPVVAWFHGGGFEIPADKSMVHEQCQLLADAGFACVAANYRQHTDGAAEFYLPAQLYDAKAVIRWIRANAERYGLDGERIGAIGGSAGAFLSATLGTSGGEAEGDVGPYLGYPSDVQVSVGLAGVYDLLAYYARPIKACAALPIGDSRCFENELFYCYFNDPACLERMRLSSAFHHVSPGDATSLVAIGTLDATPNGLADHEAYHAALLAAGVDSTLLIMDGYEHAELWPDIAPVLLAFFAERLR